LVRRIAEARHQLVVLFFRLVFFLFEAMQHDVRIRDALEPRQAALDFAGIGRLSGRGGDPVGPARGVLLLLFRQPLEDLLAPLVALAIREMAIGGRGLDFAAPHLSHRCQIDGLDRHQPTIRSNTTIVAMPAAISSTWRAALASMSPRCKSGMRSAMAM